MTKFLENYFVVHLGAQHIENDDKHMKKPRTLGHIAMIVKAVPADGGGIKKRRDALTATIASSANEAEHISESTLSNSTLPNWKPTKDQCLRILRMKDVLVKTGLILPRHYQTLSIA